MPGEAEVDQFDLRAALLAQHHILRLQIQMGDVPSVKVLQGAQNLIEGWEMKIWDFSDSFLVIFLNIKMLNFLNFILYGYIFSSLMACLNGGGGGFPGKITNFARLQQNFDLKTISWVFRDVLTKNNKILNPGNPG